jgi:phosphoribosylaminoimidazole-succinocarboxamide synthase
VAPTQALFETSLPGCDLRARGKVRDVYNAGEYLVIVATDRLSAFDYILPTPIPDKGRVLTQTTLFWLELLDGILPNHFVSADVADYPAPFPQYRDQLEGRSMLVRRANMIDVECVARGYVSGSGWKDYQRTGAICGIHRSRSSHRRRRRRADTTRIFRLKQWPIELEWNSRGGCARILY